MPVRGCRQVRVDRDLLRANARCSAFNYKTGDKVLKQIHSPTKLGTHWEGPFPIHCNNVNGNATVEMHPGVHERLNIHRVKPYHPPTVAPTISPLVE